MEYSEGFVGLRGAMVKTSEGLCLVGMSPMKLQKFGISPYTGVPPKNAEETTGGRGGGRK